MAGTTDRPIGRFACCVQRAYRPCRDDGGGSVPGNELDFGAHALEDALQEVVAGDEIRAVLLSVESHNLAEMIERLDCEAPAGRS